MKKFLVVVSTLILCSCGDVMYAHEFNDAYNRCKDKGGVSKIYRDPSAIHAICVDGSKETYLGDKSSLN